MKIMKTRAVAEKNTANRAKDKWIGGEIICNLTEKVLMYYARRS